MLSSVEAWWAGLYALPFDKAQGDSTLFRVFTPFVNYQHLPKNINYIIFDGCSN